MTDYPRHPERTDEGPARSHPQSGSRPWWTYGLVLGVVAVLALMVVLHLTGVVGAGSH